MLAYRAQRERPKRALLLLAMALPEATGLTPNVGKGPGSKPPNSDRATGAGVKAIVMPETQTPELARCSAMNGFVQPKPAVVSSWTEWQPLKEIIVGRTEKSCIPFNEPAFEAKLRFSDHKMLASNGRVRDEQHIAKGEEEIQGLIDVLEAHGVVVRRPELIDWSKPYSTPDFEAPCGNTGAMPRDVMRLGRDLFVCNSFTTNRKGYDWLRRHYNQRGIRVHFIDFPDDTAPMHLDVNFVPLNSNTVLLNPVRPPRPWVRRLLEANGWNVITGVSNGLPTPELSQCSEWLALNVLSIDEKRVCVEASETKLQDLLASHGFEPIPVPLRSIASFGGAFHCCTTDVRREGELESYFPHIDELEAAGLECQFAPVGADAPAIYS
jgi:hypothetical protein